jgi:Ca-activated chloride channel family protein
MMHLEWPWALALLPLPLLLRYTLKPAGRLRDAALRVPMLDDFADSVEQGHAFNARRGLLLLAALAWIALVVAASRPQWEGERIDIPVSGRDLMLAVDLSGSMQMDDFNIQGQKVNRLSAAKYVAEQFIAQRKGDRIGLILFGSQAYMQTPLTFDLHTVNQLLQEAAIGLAGKETAIGDAIGLAVKRLKDQDQASRVLILMTDGANTAGEVDPLQAAQVAAEQGLKIYTIGIGADKMVRYSIFGAQRINPSTDLDEKTLTAIAETTGGRYFRARDTEELRKIYQLLDELEPVEQDTQSFRPVTALFYWPLSIALLLAMLIAVLRLAGWSR